MCLTQTMKEVPNIANNSTKQCRFNKALQENKNKTFQEKMLTQNRTIYCPTDGEVLNLIEVIWNPFVK